MWLWGKHMVNYSVRCDFSSLIWTSHTSWALSSWSDVYFPFLSSLRMPTPPHLSESPLTLLTQSTSLAPFTLGCHPFPAHFSFLFDFSQTPLSLIKGLMSHQQFHKLFFISSHDSTPKITLQFVLRGLNPELTAVFQLTWTNCHLSDQPHPYLIQQLMHSQSSVHSSWNTCLSCH